MNNYLIDGLASVFDSRLFKPFLIYGFIIALSFVLPEKYIFTDESFIELQQVLLYGASFFLFGWLVGSYGRRGN